MSENTSGLTGHGSAAPYHAEVDPSCGGAHGHPRGWHKYRGGRHGGGGWGGPPFGHGGPWARGPRARRGDVRIAVLALLAESPMHGYQIIQELGERSGGQWRPSAGSVYPTLQLLEDEGLVSASEQDGKRVFELSDAGRKVLAERKDTTPPWEQMAGDVDDDDAKLMSSVRAAGAAAMQAFSAGSPEQRRKVAEVLDEARKRIYAILAEDA